MVDRSGKLVRFSDLSLLDRAEVQMLLRDSLEFIIENRHLVQHKSDQPSRPVYIGRPTQWGNPFPLEDYRGSSGEYAARALCLMDYTSNLLHGTQVELRDQLYLLRGRTLTCWCRRYWHFDPLWLCHGDVLSYLANKLGSF